MNTFLIDTHTLLWYLSGDKSISTKVKNLISDTNNTCFISVCSLWEIAIKLNLGKLTLDFEFQELANILIENDFDVLQIDFAHIVELQELEQIHKDPFDRLLISQAKAEKIPILSKDSNFGKYKGLEVIW